MTLGRRLAYQISAMIVGLLLVSSAAVWGLASLRHSYAAALAGYEQLRRVYAVGSHVATARTLVSLSRHGEPSALAELRIAQQLIDSSPTRSTHSAAIRKGILELIRELESRRASPTPQTDLLDPTPFTSIEQAVTALAADIRAEIQRAQQTADTRRRGTILTVASVCAVVILAALLLGLSQYRSVMKPLRSLSAAVKRIAAGDFSSKVPTEGPAEFAILATDFNRTARELETLYRDLEDKAAQKGRQLVRAERLASVGHLAAGVAHEINNPLGIIAGHAELSLQRLDGAGAGAGVGSDLPIVDEMRHTLQAIADEAFRCKGITQKLLSLVRPGDEQRRVIALEAVARSVVSLLSTLPEHRGRRISLQVQEGADTRILASEVEMKQVLINLALNALESLPAGGGAVTLALGRRGDSVELSISDTGRGMAAEVLEHVFEPFFTTKRGAGSPGTGLGLSISHAIVTAHQGTLTAQSAGAGKGSTFTLTLPAAGDTDAGAGPAPAAAGRAWGAGSIG